MGSLLKRIAKRHGPQLPTAAERERIARAAHAAVIEMVQPDLVSKSCLDYALAAQAILWTVFDDREWAIQCGSARLWTGYEDYFTGYDTKEGHAGLVHAWLAKPHKNTAIIFDVTTRHFTDGGPGKPWKRGELLYLYGLHGELWKAGDQYRATAEETQRMMDGIGGDEDRALCRAAVGKYRGAIS
jgi:hypothetical protein